MQEQLDRIAAFFRLGKVLSFKKAGGYTSANYFVSTARGDYLIKILAAPCDAEDRGAVQAYLERLAASGFSAMPCLKTKGGNFLFIERDFAATVQKKLDAEAPDSLTEDMIAQIGTELALLHLVPHGHLPERKNWLDQAHLTEMASAMMQTSREAEGAGELISTYATLMTVWSALPQAIIHGDLYADNTLFRGNKLACFIDWDEVTIGAAVLDFGTAIIGCCFKDNQFDPKLYASLRRSYEAIRSFSDEEKNAVTAAVRYSAITCAIWRLLNRDRLGDRYKLYWTQELDRWKAP